MSKINWIQLSDLHFGDTSPYSKKSREALLEFIDKRCKDIDYVFVTGDIIFAKSLQTEKLKKEAYKEAEKYLKEIYSLLWTDDTAYEKLNQRIFMVPGNHDIVRDNARASCIEGLNKAYFKDTMGNIDSSFLDNTKAAMKYYNAFYNRVTGKRIQDKQKKNMHYVLETDIINILHINTCVASCADGDDGKLILGFKLLNDAIEGIKNNKPTIAIAHHNFDCFNKEEQRKLELLLKEKNILLYLCGHAHERESNLVLRYNQTKMLNTFTCGTLLSGERDIIDTVFFRGELDTECYEGRIESYKWTLDDGWHEDMEFGLVQKNNSNYRTFKDRVILDGEILPMDLCGGGVLAKIVRNRSSERHNTFQSMNERAENSLSIYGVGITSVSQTTGLFDRILEAGGTVRLCMVNPCIFKEESCLDTSKTAVESKLCEIENLKFCIYAKHIDQYVRRDYYDAIQRSYERIKAYKEDAKGKKGKLEVKLLKSFIPISINIINEKTAKAELIVEYNMPFTSKRLLLNLNMKKHEEYYMQVKEVFDDIWNRAEEMN